MKAATAAIPAGAWQAIEYTDAIFDQATPAWISTAEVAEIPFTAFAAQQKANQIPGRLVVRRIPDLNPHTGQATLFDTWRFHALFTTTPGHHYRGQGPAPAFARAGSFLDCSCPRLGGLHPCRG